MPIIPKTDNASIEYCETHTPVWLENAAELGLDPLAVTELETMTEAARAAMEAAESARLAAMSATLTLNNRIDTMRRRAQQLLGQIKATAALGAGNRLLATAQVPGRKPRARLSPPTQPSSVTMRLMPEGSVRLSWTSGNAAPSTGGFFRVERRLDGERGYTVIGGTPVREFIDGTIPLGTRWATYIVTPFRGRREGVPSVAVGVNFGVAPERMRAAA